MHFGLGVPQFLSCSSRAAKVEEVEKKEHPDHEDEDADADDDAAKRLEESEEVQVRDIRYNLESLVPH